VAYFEILIWKLVGGADKKALGRSENTNAWMWKKSVIS